MITELNHLKAEDMTDQQWENMTDEQRVEWAAEECFLELTNQKLFKKKKWTEFEYNLFLQGFSAGYKWFELSNKKKNGQ